MKLKINNETEKREFFLKTYILSGHVTCPQRPLAPPPLGLDGHMSKNIFFFFTNFNFVFLHIPLLVKQLVATCFLEGLEARPASAFNYKLP